MLTFLGNGGAFDTKNGNTNAFYKSNDELLLIDCGSKAFFDIQKHKLFDGIKKITIIITHLHADHFGGLASICDYLYYNNLVNGTGVDYKIFYPDSKNISTILKLMHIEDIDSHLFSISDCKYIKKVFTADHFSNAYSYLLEIDEKSVYYSGDTCHINNEAISLLLSNQIDFFFHEVTDRKNPYHTHYSEFDTQIPKNHRNKVFCTHLSDETAKIVQELGFNLPKILK